jgi:hypothetical protein
MKTIVENIKTVAKIRGNFDILANSRDMAASGAGQ